LRSWPILRQSRNYPYIIELNVHYHIYNSPLPVPILSQINLPQPTSKIYDDNNDHNKKSYIAPDSVTVCLAARIILYYFILIYELSKVAKCLHFNLSRRLGKIAKNDSFVMSVRPFTWDNSASTRGIFMNFDI